MTATDRYQLAVCDHCGEERRHPMPAEHLAITNLLGGEPDFESGPEKPLAAFALLIYEHLTMPRSAQDVGDLVASCLLAGVTLALAAPEWAHAAVLDLGVTPERLGDQLAGQRAFIATHPVTGGAGR